MTKQTTEEVSYNRGYDKGLFDTQEKLSREFNRVLIIKEDLAYEKGYEHGIKKTEEKYQKLYDPNNRKKGR